MARPIEAVVFDMDGVLIDSEPIWRDVEKEVFRGVGIELTDDDLVRTMGVRIGEVVDRWYRRRPWAGRSEEDVVKAIVEGVAQTIAREGKLNEGAAEAIGYADRLGLRLALASSSPMRLIQAVLSRREGLAERFEVILSADEEERGKPHPAVYMSAARALKVPPERCLAIEDSVSGVRAAKAAGMVCVVVPDPLVPEEVVAEADLILGSLSEFDDRVWAATRTEPIRKAGAETASLRHGREQPDRRGR